MNDFMRVEIVHATSDLLGPVQDKRGWDFLAVPQDFVQLAIGAVLHDDAVAWGLCAHTPETV